jgi:hypothetical protein
MASARTTGPRGDLAGRQLPAAAPHQTALVHASEGAPGPPRRGGPPPARRPRGGWLSVAPVIQPPSDLSGRRPAVPTPAPDGKPYGANTPRQPDQRRAPPVPRFVGARRLKCSISARQHSEGGGRLVDQRLQKTVLEDQVFDRAVRLAAFAVVPEPAVGQRYRVVAGRDPLLGLVPDGRDRPERPVRPSRSAPSPDRRRCSAGGDADEQPRTRAARPERSRPVARGGPGADFGSPRPRPAAAQR